ncbi:MAG: hypothetical protein EOO75_12040 [Myxococcales bacterium]|nr:MAG: hypothetical protein EOO75_12040 [Myxococcales bacterium]
MLLLSVGYLDTIITPAGTRVGLGRAAGAGLILGVLSLFKPEFCLWGGLLGLAAWLRGATLPRVAAVLAAGGLCAFLVIAPWTIRNARAFHRFIPFSVAAGHTFWPSAHRPDFVDVEHPAFQEAARRCSAGGADRIRYESCLWDDAVRMVKEHPGYYSLTVVKRAARLFAGSHTESDRWLSASFLQCFHEGRFGLLALKLALFSLNTGFFVLGLGGLAWFCREGIRWVLVGAVLMKVTVHALMMASPRYGLQLVPTLAGPAAAMALLVVARLSRPTPAPAVLSVAE